MNNKDLQKAYDYLVSNKIVDEHILDDAFKKSKKDNVDIFDVLIEKKIISEEELTKIKAVFLGVPYIKLKDEFTADAQPTACRR